MSILTLQIVVTVCLVSLMCALQTQRKYYWTITRHNTKETKQFQRHISTIYPKKKFTSEEVPYNKRENKPLHEYSSTSESPQYEVINDRSTVWLRRVRLLGVTETLSSRQPERVWPKPDLGITYRERKRALTNINRLDLQRQSPNSHSDGNSMSKHLLNLSKANLVQLKNIEQTRKYRSNNAIKMGKLKGKRRSEVRDDPNFKVRHNLHGRRPCSYHNKDDTDAASEATPRTALVSKFSRYIFVKDNKMRKNAYISGLNSLHGYQNNKTKLAHVFMKSNSFLEPSTPSSHSDNIFNKHLQKTSILNQDNLVVEQSILAASVTDKYMAIHRLLSDQLNTSGLNDLMVFLNVHFLKKNFNSLDNLESRVSNIRRPSTKIPDNKLSFQPVESFHDEINMSDETPSINDQIKLSAHTGPYNVQNQQIKAIDQFDIGDLLKRQKNPFQGNHLDGIQFDRVDHLHEEISVGNKVDDTAQSKMQDALKEASASSLYILLTLERVSLKNLTTKLSQNKEWKFYKWTNSQFAKRLFATSSRKQLVGLISNEKTRDLKNANLNRRPINNRTKGNKLRLRTEHFFDQDGHKLFLDSWNVGGANISPSSIFLVSKSAGSKTVKELSVRRSDVKRTASLSYRRKIELKLTTLGRTNRLEKSPEILASRHNTKPDRETRATVTKLSNAFVYVPRLTSLVNRHEKDLRIVGLKHKKNKKLFLPKSNKIQRHSREYIYNTKNTVTWNKDGVFNDINFSSIQLRTTGENKKADNINKNGHPKAFNDHKIVDTRTDLERVNSNERSVDSHMWGRFYQSKPGMVIANVSLNNQRRYELQRLALRSSAQSQYVNATFRKKNIDSSATVKSQLLNKNDLSNKSQLNQLSSFSTVTQNNGMRVFSPDVSGHNKQYNFNIFSLSGIELDKLKNVMSSVGIEHNEKFISSAANGHKGQYKDIALANTAHVNLNHVITSVGIEHNEHTTVASLANTKPDEQAKVRSILPESFMLDELQESVMCNSMKDQALCLTLSPLSDPLVQSLDYGLVHGYSSYEELFHLKEETVKNGSTTNERPRVANLTKRMKRSESLPTESPWQDVTPTLTTPTGSADTSSTSTTHTSAGNFQHKKVSLFRINQPSLDLTHIMYVPENQSVHSHQLSHFHWKNEAIDQQGKPIIKIGVILVAKSSALFSLNKSRSAIELAGEKIISPTGSLPGYSIQIVFRDSGCSDTHGPLAGIDLYMLKLANVYIGPSCDYALAPLARFTPFWGDGIPILTAGGLVGAFADKNTFKLLTRMQASHTKTSQFVMSIFMAFGWSTFGTVYYNVPLGTRRPQSDCSFIITEIVTNLEPEFKHKPWYYPFDEKNMDNSTLDTVLHEIQRNSRIVVLCASPNTVREIMIKAHELNFDNGEYVFFNIDLFSSKNASETPWYRADDTEERNIKARRAYESLMTVTLRTPTSAEYRHFSNEVKARASEMFPNFTYGEDEVNSFVGAFHDAVLLYALALNETLAENGSISDGHAITKKMWNRTFAG
uniref:Receptor ligand binding region domain-containing protein n=1 Tax=Biomphalaria glabrata TaxID=6526 RepID=A0A2C9KEF9_BIOGL